MDDNARVVLLKQIPDFLDNVVSDTYLTEYAEIFFKGDNEKMQLFKKSLKNQEYLEQKRKVKEAIERYHKGGTFNDDHCLRILLKIFIDVKNDEEYSYPKYIQEMAPLKDSDRFSFKVDLNLPESTQI